MERFWTQQQDMGPSPRAGAAMAVADNALSCLLFGGYAGATLFGDTWVWQGGLWSQVDDIGPSRRSRAAIATVTRGQILFGGGTDSGAARDTWLRSDGHWTQIGDTGPSGRAWSRMVAVAPERLLLFGGEDDGGVTSGDTWLFVNDSWTQVADTGPSARSGHGMVFDHARNRVLLFGGWDGSAALSDTWGWDGSTWVQLQDTGTGPLAGAAAVAASGVLTIFGGVSAPASGTTPMGDTWQWDGAFWTQMQDFGPDARWDAAAANGPGGTMVLFGGITSGDQFRNDTWTLEVGPVIARAAEPVTPPLPDPNGPVPDPGDPNSGNPAAPSNISADSVLTLSLPTAPFYGGSPLGFVVVDLSAPAPVDTPLEVTVDGVAWDPQPLSNIWAGESRATAYFTFPRGGRQLKVRVTVKYAASTAQIDLTSVYEPFAISGLILMPRANIPGGTLTVEAFTTVESWAPAQVTLDPLERGLGVLAPIQVEASATRGFDYITLPTDALPGEYHFITVLTGYRLWVEMGPTFTVTVPDDPV